MTYDEVMELAREEFLRATDKFPLWPTRGIDAATVVAEEVGEVQKAVLQLTYEPHKTSRADLRDEAIQLAAMAVRFAMSLDYYDYNPGEQHSQNNDLQRGYGT